MLRDVNFLIHLKAMYRTYADVYYLVYDFFF